MIGQEIKLGKKKGVLKSFKEEEEIGGGVKKLAHYVAEVENPWGIDEVDVPVVAIRKRGDRNGK